MSQPKIKICSLIAHVSSVDVAQTVFPCRIYEYYYAWLEVSVYLLAATVYFLVKASWAWCKGNHLIRGLTDHHLFFLFSRKRMCHPGLLKSQNMWSNCKCLQCIWSLKMPPYRIYEYHYGLMLAFICPQQQFTFWVKASWTWCKGSCLIRGLTDNHLFFSFSRNRMCHPGLQPSKIKP